MVLEFVARDRKSKEVDTQTATVTTREELLAAWEEFCQNVPFAKWYPDNQFISGTKEEEAWCDDLE